uniref:Secreted protein n=1 Tax=Meloidogyne incognita TaxID=6306 RepID=A0A914LAV0_MELIC
MTMFWASIFWIDSARYPPFLKKVWIPSDPPTLVRLNRKKLTMALFLFRAFQQHYFYCNNLDFCRNMRMVCLQKALHLLFPFSILNHFTM